MSYIQVTGDLKKELSDTKYLVLQIEKDRDHYKALCDELAGALKLCHRRMKHTAWVEDECFDKAREALAKWEKGK